MLMCFEGFNLIDGDKGMVKGCFVCDDWRSHVVMIYEEKVLG